MNVFQAVSKTLNVWQNSSAPAGLCRMGPLREMFRKICGNAVATEEDR